MRRGTAWAGWCGLLAAVGLVAGPQAVRAAADGDAYLGTYSYGSHKRQTVGAYRTSGPGTRPVVMILHGGYWAQDSDWSSWARKLAARGFVVFDVDYRLNTDAQWPAQRTDALAALRWIHEKAADFQADPEQVVLLGSSAGGQIAVNTAEYAAGRPERPAGVVALSPVADPYLAWKDGARAGASAEQRRLRREARKLAGCDPSDKKDTRCRKVWRDMAARTWAPGGPERAGGPGMPMLLLHFAEDFVPATHSEGLAAAEPAAAVSVVPGQGHGMGVINKPAYGAKVLAWISGQVQRHMPRTDGAATAAGPPER